MATELITRLELDIKPFLDAIKRAANQLDALEDVRVNFNTDELEQLQRELLGIKPEINVAVDVEKRELDAVEGEINQISADPVRLDVLVNSEEIQTSVNRVRELRGTVLNIPAKTDLQIDDNSKIVKENIGEIKTDVTQLTANKNIIPFDVNSENVINEIGVIKTNVNELTSSKNTITFDPNFITLFEGLDKVRNSIQTIKGEAVSLIDFSNAVKGDEELDRSILRVRDILDELFATGQRDFTLDFNEQEIEQALNAVRDQARLLGVDFEKINNFLFPFENANDQVRVLINSLQEVASQFRVFENEIREGVKTKADIILDVLGYEESKNQVQQINNEIEKLPESQTISLNAEGSEEVKKDIEGVNTVLNILDDTNTVKVDINGEENVKRELNLIEKDVKDIPNQKNVKINIDQAGISNIQKTTSAIGGFAGQLGSGLLASFSGAAIGAAIANFGSQAVRAIVSASDAADELQDKLRLAFTQAGAEGFVLDENLRRANEFAFQLGDNFGISIRRSQELLAQVVGLTGEFGATSEAITKASLGIEEATGGLVKAETAAKLFSRSIGNPEDQAALETLAKRFPAIGEAIQGATDPAEKANAVLTNLTGTFTALEEKALGFGENFQLLTEVAFATFATAVVPIADSLVPILERLTALIIDNADEIASFGQSIVNNFIDPLLTQIDRLAPSFENFFTNLGDTLSIIATTGFGTLTNNLELIAFSFGLIGDILRVLNPLLETVASSLGQLIQPIVQTLSGDVRDLNNPLAELTGGLLDFKDNAFSLAPILERLSNSIELLKPLITAVSNVIYITLLGALDALEIQLGLLLLPSRALNLLFDAGKTLAQEFGISIDGLANSLSNLNIIGINVLGPLGQLVGSLLQGLNTLSKQPLGRINLGDTTPIENFDNTLFDAVDTGQKFEQQFGIKIPKAVSTFNKLLGGATGETKKNTEATNQNISALQRILDSYGKINTLVEANRQIREATAQSNEATLELGLQRQLTDYEKIYRAQVEINDLKEDQKILEENFAKALGVSTNNLKNFVEAYLKSGDLSTLPIFFDPKDPKSISEAERIAGEFVKLYKSSIETETKLNELELTFDLATIEINKQAITTQLDDLQTSFGRQLQQFEFGQISIGEIDVSKFRNSLLIIRDSAQESLNPFAERLAGVRDQISKTINRITELKTANGDNSEEIRKQEAILGQLQDRYNVLTEQSRVFQGALDQTTNTLNTLGETLEQSILNRFRRLSELQETQITLDLNAEGVNEGLIEIERNFARSVNAIEASFAIARARIEAQRDNQVGPSEALKSFAEAQRKALQNVVVQREIAVRQFRLQNDAFFAINEALRNNLATALVPNTIAANRAFNERKASLDSELELLRTNLDLGVISYQEYNAKVLDLEKQKSDSIKQLEEETNQARLEGLQRIANEALPAINNQLLVANTELTGLLLDSASTFEEVAAKGLETIGLVAAQSVGLALQQAKSLEEVQKLFLRNLASGVLRLLRVQLEAAILQALFKEISEKSFAGLITGAIISGILTGLFAAAEAKILGSIGGFESGGYTGDAGTKEVAGVVHGQEFVVNARGTKDNRDLLEWLNKGKPAESFFDQKPNDISVNNYVDTKALNSSINGLAYTMDARLSSLETTVDKAIRQNASLTRSANQLDVSVYSDPGTAIKYMKKIGKIKGLS